MALDAAQAWGATMPTKLIAALAGLTLLTWVSAAQATVFSIHVDGVASGTSLGGLLAPNDAAFTDSPFTFDGWFKSRSGSSYACSNPDACSVETFGGGPLALYGTVSLNGRHIDFGRSYSFAYAENEPGGVTRYVFYMERYFAELPPTLALRFVFREPTPNGLARFDNLGGLANSCDPASPCEGTILGTDLEMRIDTLIVVKTAIVPEPGSWLLMCTGFLAAGSAIRSAAAVRRRRPFGIEQRHGKSRGPKAERPLRRWRIVRLGLGRRVLVRARNGALHMGPKVGPR